MTSIIYCWRREQTGSSADMTLVYTSGFSRSFTSWRETTSDTKRHHMYQSSALRRAAFLTQLRALYQWQRRAQASQSVSEKARRATMTMFNYRMARAFKRWVSKLRATRELRHGMQLQQSHLEILDLETGAQIVPKFVHIIPAHVHVPDAQSRSLLSVVRNLSSRTILVGARARHSLSCSD
jgi:hypothetical protein